MYAVRPADPVQEEQTVGVVDLVLQRHRLETVGVDHHPLPGQRELASKDQTPAPGHVPGKVRDRHAALTAAPAASGTDDHGVAQHEQPVTRAVRAWPETSTLNTLAATPTCWAASPTQPGETS